MSGGSQNRWIVLLNRSPKGPLTEDDVKTLLNQGILRQNDIAYLVNSGEQSGKSEWKLLWQFPEFDRRNEIEKAQQQPQQAPKERRQKTAPEEIQRKAVSDLPPDLMEITPEDLLPRSTQVSFNPEPETIAPANDGTLPSEPRERSLHFDFRWAYGAVGIAVISLFLMNWPTLIHRGENKEAEPSSAADNRRPAMRDGELPSAPVVGKDVPMPDLHEAVHKMRQGPPGARPGGTGGGPGRNGETIPANRDPDEQPRVEEERVEEAPPPAEAPKQPAFRNEESAESEPKPVEPPPVDEAPPGGANGATFSDPAPESDNNSGH